MDTTRTPTSAGTVSPASTASQPGTITSSPPGSPVPPAAQPEASPPSKPLTPAEVVATLDPGLLTRLATWRADMENWIAAGRALVDRAFDHVHDANRK